MNSARFRLLAWGVALYTLLVILWGYFLRISESGDGCGTDWPLCHGAALPSAPAFSTLVELSHRVTSGVVLLAALGLLVAAFRSYPRGHLVRKGAAATLVLTLTESLFGAILVVFGWVAGDVSTGRILIRPVHVTNTFLLMAALALTAWWATRGVRNLSLSVPADEGGRTRPLVLPLAGVMALAWTGAWTGLAVTAFPAATLEEGLGQYLNPEHLLVSLRMLHPVLAVVVVAIVLRFAGRSMVLGKERGDRGLLRLGAGVGFLAGIQLLVGPATIALGNPAWMRLLHLLLADLLWVGVVLAASARLEGAPVRRG